jgi:hypothetical protein
MGLLKILNDSIKIELENHSDEDSGGSSCLKSKEKEGKLNF